MEQFESKEKTLLITLTLLFLIFGLYSFAFAIHARSNGISNSVHDFSSAGWNPTRETCRVCHVPHDHQRTTYLNNTSGGLLWNHEVSSATYTMYDSSWSSSLDNTQSSQPDGLAKLCLGCHDGTSAIDAFDKYAGGSWNMYNQNPNLVIPGNAVNGNRDLRGTHPLSIEYNSDESLLNPDTDPMGSYGDIASVLDNGKVVCSSCHDVHEQETDVGTFLLRVAQKNMGGGEQPSGLCLTCHIK